MFTTDQIRSLHVQDITSIKFSTSICYSCMCCRYRRFSSKTNQINCNQYEISLSLCKFFKSTIYCIVHLKRQSLWFVCCVKLINDSLNRPLSFSFRGCLPSKNNHSLVKYSSCPHRNRPRNPSIVKHNNIGVRQTAAIKAILHSRCLVDVLQVWQNPFP